MVNCRPGTATCAADRRGVGAPLRPRLAAGGVIFVGFGLGLAVGLYVGARYGYSVGRDENDTNPRP